MIFISWYPVQFDILNWIITYLAVVKPVKYYLLIDLLDLGLFVYAQCTPLIMNLNKLSVRLHQS